MSAIQRRYLDELHRDRPYPTCHACGAAKAPTDEYERTEDQGARIGPIRPNGEAPHPRGRRVAVLTIDPASARMIGL